MAAIAALDKKQSSFFSHYDPNMVEWFAKWWRNASINMIPARKEKLVIVKAAQVECAAFSI